MKRRKLKMICTFLKYLVMNEGDSKYTVLAPYEYPVLYDTAKINVQNSYEEELVFV